MLVNHDQTDIIADGEICCNVHWFSCSEKLTQLKKDSSKIYIIEREYHLKCIRNT